MLVWTINCTKCMVQYVHQNSVDTSYLHRASKYQKSLFIVPTDAHYYKTIEMLKQCKNYNTCFHMFRFTQEPSSGSSPVLSRNYKYVFSVLVGMDAVNVMAAYALVEP